MLNGADLLELRIRPTTVMRWLLGTAAVLCILLIWTALTSGDSAEVRVISPTLLPSPQEVGASLTSLISERGLFQSIAASLQRVLLGFALAILVGVPLGVLAASWRGVEAFLAPVSLFGRNIPIAALVPLTLIWFGIGEEQKVMFIFIACVPFIFGDAVRAVLDVPGQYVETARTLGASRLQTVVKVLLPLALPSIYDGLRILFGLAFGYIMLAEMINAEHGLGHLINLSQRRGLMADMYMILIAIGLIAYGIDRLLWFFQQGLFPYIAKEQ